VNKREGADKRGGEAEREREREGRKRGKSFTLTKLFPRKHVSNKNFHECKIISLKTGLYQKLSSNIFGQNVL
jgi:hypothetical protein